jgi:hypothetical protein
MLWAGGQRLEKLEAKVEVAWLGDGNHMVSASQYPQSINVDPGLELRLGREVENGGTVRLWCLEIILVRNCLWID